MPGDDFDIAQPSPLSLLSDYARRADAQPAAETPEPSLAQWSGMLCRLGSRRGFVPVDAVSEVIDMPRLTAVPGTVSWYLGLGSLRGRVLPVCDLGGFLFGHRSNQRALRRVLVHGRETDAVGLAVDDLLGVHTVECESGELVSDTVSHQGDALTVLQLDDIVSQSRFLHVSLDSV